MRPARSLNLFQDIPHEYLREGERLYRHSKEQLVTSTIYLQGRALTQLSSHRSQPLSVAPFPHLCVVAHIAHIIFLADPLGVYTQSSTFARQCYSNHPVPSIATEFVRKRPMHDHIARQWTEMYAKPPPPPSSSPSAAPSSPSSSSVNNAGASTDSGRTSAKGKGRANAQPADTDRATDSETTGIDLTNEGVEAGSYSTRGSKRRKDIHSTDGVIDLSEGVESSSTRSGKRRRVEKLGDVIVIDD